MIVRTISSSEEEEADLSILEILLFVFVAKGVSPLADVRDVNDVGDDR